MGAAVKRLAAHIGRRLSGDADLEQDLAVEGAFADAVSAVIGQVDAVVRPHVDAMGARPQAFAPGAQEIALAVEHHDRVFAAIERVNIVLGVDPDGGDLLERPAGRQLRPILDDAVFEVAATDDFWHSGSSLCGLQCTRSYFCSERM